MSNIAAIARPYAKAVFELAQEQKNLESWSDGLKFLTSVMNDKSINDVIYNPRVANSKVAEILKSLYKDQSFASDEFDRFIDMIVKNERYDAVSAMSTQYDALKADAESVVHAMIETAQPISDDEMKKLSSSLEKKFGKKVEVTSKINQDLVGGVLIRVGDLVIDDSIAGKLKQLAESLH